MTITVMFILLWIVVLVNLFLTIRLTQRLRDVLTPQLLAAELPTLPVGSAAPNFTAQSLDGEVVTLESFADRQLVLIFTSPRCSACLAELPNLIRLFPTAQRAGIELVLVSADARADLERLARTFNIPMTILLASPEGSLFQRYNSERATPFYYLIDQGHIQSRGMIGSDEWVQLVQSWQASATAQRAEFRRYT